MTKNYRRLAPLLLSVSASTLLVSCVDPGYSSGGGHSSRGYGSTVYTTLPNTFTGNAYYYNGRYYSGGDYQTGRYHDHGRTYSTRYYHNGTYFYGGDYQKHTARPVRKDDRRDYDRDRSDRRDVPGSMRPFDRNGGQVPAVQSRYY
ncbi:MAG: hypothetical protein RLZZ214_1094 [Verrucomicrobiota bacterium]|jgi:hypothetical protein